MANKKYNQKDINYIVTTTLHIIPEIRDAIKEDMCRQMKIPVEIVDKKIKEFLNKNGKE